MAKSMKQPKPPPWRCRFCVKVRSGVDDSCPDCWRHWSIADDPTFQPPQPQKSNPKDKNADPGQWTWEIWPSHDVQMPAKRKPSRSTSRKQKQRQEQARKKDAAATANPFHAGQAGPSTSPFLQSYTGQAGPTSTMTPWVPEVKKEPVSPPMDSALLAAIRKSYPDLSKAPADIRAEVEKAERLAGRTKENVGEECDAARDQLLAVMEAREQHRVRWLKHLEASVLSWQTQMASYEKQKKQYQTMVDEAKARHDAARAAMDAMNDKLGEGEARSTQIDPVETDLPGVTEAELRRNVHTNLRKCLRAVTEDAPVEISDGEADDIDVETAQPNKRVRAEDQP